MKEKQQELLAIMTMNDFHSIVTKMFAKNIYTYLENEPTKKPYLV